ncbi:MAG: ribosome-recycling factor, partial [Gemmatimonadota bacterium]
PVPPLTEERRKELVRLTHKIAEEGRVAIRNIRHEANKRIQTTQKSGEISEDEMHRRLKEVQDLTDRHIKKIDEMLERKEKEVMEV